MAKKILLSLAVVAFCCILSGPAFALEPGTAAHYPGGAEDFYAGALPPPGTQVLVNYMADIQLNGLNGNNGGTSTAFGPGVKLKGQQMVEIARYVNSTKIMLLGGNLVYTIIPGFTYQHTSISPGVLTDTEIGLSDLEFGAGVIWHHSPTLHSVLAFDIEAPTGQYSITNATNIGRNYWTFNPIYAITYIGDKSSAIPGFEVSFKFDYQINTVNAATHYTSGQVFDFDYLVGYHFCKNWAFGANGHYLYQTTNDAGGNMFVNPFYLNPDGNSSKSFSVGPALTYEFPNHGCVTVKWQNVVQATNQPTGNLFWLKFIWPW